MLGPQYPYPTTPTRRTSRARPVRGGKTVEVLTLKVVAIRYQTLDLECNPNCLPCERAGHATRKKSSGKETCQYAPSPENTARGVCRRILKSERGEQVFAYCKSSRTISSKVVLLRP